MRPLQGSAGSDADTLAYWAAYDVFGKDLALAVLEDAYVAGRLATSLSFTHAPSGTLFEGIAGSVASGPHGELSQVSILKELHLPALVDLSDDDFVAIRLQSDDFEQYRQVLARATKATAEKVAGGDRLQDAFADSVEEVRWRAELLRRDLRDDELANYLKVGAQGVALGALAAAGTDVLTGAPTTVEEWRAVAVEFGVSTTIGTLLSVLFHRRPDAGRRLLRFYDVLLATGP